MRTFCDMSTGVLARSDSRATYEKASYLDGMTVSAAC